MGRKKSASQTEHQPEGKRPSKKLVVNTDRQPYHTRLLLLLLAQLLLESVSSYPAALLRPLVQYLVLSFFLTKTKRVSCLLTRLYCITSCIELAASFALLFNAEPICEDVVKSLYVLSLLLKAVVYSLHRYRFEAGEFLLLRLFTLVLLGVAVAGAIHFFPQRVDGLTKMMLGAGGFCLYKAVSRRSHVMHSNWQYAILGEVLQLGAKLSPLGVWGLREVLLQVGFYLGFLACYLQSLNEKQLSLLIHKD